jgi:hypothetical protein
VAVPEAVSAVWPKAEAARMENKKDSANAVIFLIEKQFWFRVLEGQFMAADEIYYGHYG